MSPALAIVDCNNFYVSCERVFNPKLAGKPVVVLSNNDGCVVVRSNEAKALAIKMGVPVFKISNLIKTHGVHVLSSNYALYGDMSQRIMKKLVFFLCTAAMLVSMSSVHNAHAKSSENKAKCLAWCKNMQAKVFFLLFKCNLRWKGT